jgi:hypothetical protein
MLHPMKLLLLIQSEADVAALDAAAKAIPAAGYTGVWAVFSPAITVNASEAAAKLDSEIAQLRKAQQDASGREDYNAAAGYKQQREGKELDRAKALRDAWKTAPAEERQAKTKAIFGPFLAQLQPNGISVKVSAHSDHYDREQWVAMLNSLSGVWFKEFTPGSFVVGWPTSLNTNVYTHEQYEKDKLKHEAKLGVTPEMKEEFQKQAQAARMKEPMDQDPLPPSRAEEIAAMHPMKRKVLAKSLGIDTEGKDREKVVREILYAEQAKPVLAEY